MTSAMLSTETTSLATITSSIVGANLTALPTEEKLTIRPAGGDSPPRFTGTQLSFCLTGTLKFERS